MSYVKKVNGFFQEKIYPPICDIYTFSLTQRIEPPSSSSIIVVMPIAVGLFITECAARTTATLLLIISALSHLLSLAIAKIADICTNNESSIMPSNTLL